MNENERFLVSAWGLGENLAPLVHSEERLGTKMFFRRLSIKSGDHVVTAPVISGNSFRGAWRDLAALHLVETLGIRQVSPVAFATLFSGGLLTKGNIAQARSLYEKFAALRLLGFSMGRRMYPSRIGVDFAVPLTAETMAYARAAYPDQQADLPDTVVAIGQITAMTMMTRKQDVEKAMLVNLAIAGDEAELPEEGDTDEDDDDTAASDDDGDANAGVAPGAEAARERTQMLFHVEYVVPNTTFVHGFRTIYPVSPLEFGALLKVLELSSQRSYGGQGSRGFGRMDWCYTLTWRKSLDDPVTKSGQIRLGQDPHFDDPLADFKAQYESHIAGLSEAIRNDPYLARIIQFDSSDGGE